MPLPVPLLPEVIVSQLSLLLAVQAQPAVAVTPTLLVLLPAEKFAAIGAIE